MSIDCDVAVIGAGPTGLIAALLLARRGVSVRILDKSPSAAKESRALAIQARTLELLQSLGLVDRFIGRGVLGTGAAVYVNGKPAARFAIDDLARHDTPFPTILMLPQSDTEELLIEALGEHGISVERGIEVTALEQRDDGVRLTAAGGEGGQTAIEAAYTIGADGAHSVVRKALGLGFKGGAYPQTFLLADCKVGWELANGPFSVFMHGNDFALFLPLRGQEYGRVIALDATSAADPSMDHQGSTEVDLAEVEAAFRRATQLDVTLSDPRWLSRYRVHHRGVDSYRIGRVFVGGDAAHIHSPAGGQGMNTGLQDMANLCWKLAAVLKGGAPRELLDSYDSERRPVGERVLTDTDRAFTAVTSQNSLTSAIRDMLIPVLGATAMRSDLVRSRLFGFVSELGIRYQEGGAVLPDTTGSALAGGPAHGRRAPDARINRQTGIFDLIGDYGFTLLALSRRPIGEDEIESLSADLERFAAATHAKTHLVAHSFVGPDPRIVHAETGAAFAAYGIGEQAQALYLVRPDGYVAGRWSGLDLAPARGAMACFGAAQN